jgi:monoamine oxidase
VGRIHWAGTETAERWTGYIDGAIDSGQRVAAEILDALGA